MSQAGRESRRLIGFCLLIRRAVIEAIGLLDERFGVGCFEDDDYCLRAIAAGWRAVIAQDAFVHHFGGRTFVGSGLDHAAILRENERRFREKWGRGSRAERPAVHRCAGSAGATDRVLRREQAPDGGLLLRCRRIRLSLCMIVRDSAGPCGRAWKASVPGSTRWSSSTRDRSMRPRVSSKEFGGRLFHFPWCDDFSAARNESLRHARGEWLFWMDSDDTIPAECGRQLRKLVDREVGPERAGACHAGPLSRRRRGWRPETDVTVVDHVKLIRNRPDLRFEGRIHEQILPAIRRAGGTVAWTDLYVVHSGSDPSREAQERKRRRDLHLLHLELRERPRSSFHTV